MKSKESTSQKTLEKPSISPTLAINQQMKRLQEEGKEVFRFGFGQSPFPVPLPIVEVLAKNAFQKDYLPTVGLEQLREVVADHFSKRVSVAYSKENVMIGPGSKELLFLAQMVKESTLLLPSPSWVSYEPQAKILNRKVVWLDSLTDEGYCLDTNALAQYCKENPTENKLLILNYPNNPTGGSYPQQTLKEIAEVARIYGVLIISDEIYGQLHFKGQHQSIAQFYPEGTMITEGLSKWCGAGGWRLGVMLIPDELAALQNQMVSIASETFSCVSAPIQYAAAYAYQTSEATQKYLNHSRNILKTIAHYMAGALNEAGIKTMTADGGFYLFPDFSNFQKQLQQKNINNSSGLCNALLQETGVALLPGTAFGRMAENLTARLAYVDFDGSQALKWGEENNTEHLGGDFLNNCCPQIIEGTKRITQWINRIA